MCYTDSYTQDYKKNETDTAVSSYSNLTQTKLSQKYQNNTDLEPQGYNRFANFPHQDLDHNSSALPSQLFFIYQFNNSLIAPSYPLHHSNLFSHSLLYLFNINFWIIHHIVNPTFLAFYLSLKSPVARFGGSNELESYLAISIINYKFL